MTETDCLFSDGICADCEGPLGVLWIRQRVDLGDLHYYINFCYDHGVARFVSSLPMPGSGATSPIPRESAERSAQSC